MSFVSRVNLEKVGGEYQGACFVFAMASTALRFGWNGVRMAQCTSAKAIAAGIRSAPRATACNACNGPARCPLK